MNHAHSSTWFGAREHALVLSLFHDPAVDDIHVAPGNVGMKPLATLHSEVTRIDDPDTVVALARDIAADLVVIGPEIPLVAGVADALRSAGFLVFGPNKAAARIEGSKAFAKDVMAAAGVRTARSEQLTSELSDSEIESALDRFGPHYVVKDDGLPAAREWWSPTTAPRLGRTWMRSWRRATPCFWSHS